MAARSRTYPEVSAASSLLPPAGVQTPKSEAPKSGACAERGGGRFTEKIDFTVAGQKGLGGRNKAFHSYNALAAEDALHVLNRRFLRLRDLLAILEGLHGR